MTVPQRLLLLPLAAAALTGCLSLQRGDVIPDDRDTVYVAYFGNETFYRDMEFELTERVVEEILSSPGLRLSSKEEAEILLAGRIVEVLRHVVAEDQTQTPISTAETVTVEVSLVDARSGRVLKQNRLTAKGRFTPGLGQDESFARAEAFRYLARDIVREFEEDF